MWERSDMFTIFAKGSREADPFVPRSCPFVPTRSFLATYRLRKLWGSQFWLQPAFQPAFAW